MSCQVACFVAAELLFQLIIFPEPRGGRYSQREGGLLDFSQSPSCSVLSPTISLSHGARGAAPAPLPPRWRTAHADPAPLTAPRYRRSRRLEGPPRGAAAAASHCWLPPHLPRGRCEAGPSPPPSTFRVWKALPPRGPTLYLPVVGFFFFFRLPRERFIHTIKVNRKVQQDRVSSAFPSSSTRSEGLRRAQRRRAARRHCPAEQHGAHGTRRCRQTVPSPHPVPVPAALLLPAQSFQAAPTQEAAPPPGTARAKYTPPPPLRGLSGQREQK